MLQPLRNLRELHAVHPEDLLQESIALNPFPLVRVLQLVRFDVLPQGVDDNRASLSMHAQQRSQTPVQLELQRLEVEQKQDRAPNIFVSRAFHLEPVGFLRSGCAVPFHEVVVRAVQVLVEFDDEAFEEG